MGTEFILFGGSNDTGYLEDTWRWRNGQWKRLNPQHRPSARDGHGMVFDQARDVIVLYGGRDATGVRGDTWEWDGNDWTQIALTEDRPRTEMGIAYDASRLVVVRYGGFTGGGRGANTWEYDGTSWTRVVQGSPPGFRARHAMTHDQSTGNVLLYGGEAPGGAMLGDTWSFDGTNWTQVPANGPGLRSTHTLVSDSDCGSVYLYGGKSSSGDAAEDLWAYSSGSWTQIPYSGIGTTSASPRKQYNMFYDSSLQGLVVFGGGDSQGLAPYTWLRACAEPGTVFAHPGFGMDQYSSGNANLIVGDDSFVVGNVGAVPEDGVLVEYGEVGQFDMCFDPPLQPTQVGSGASTAGIPGAHGPSAQSRSMKRGPGDPYNGIDVAFRARVDSSTAGPGPVVAFRGSGREDGSFDLGADFGELGSSTLTVEVWNDDQLVYDQSGLPNDSLIVSAPVVIDGLATGIDADGYAFQQATIASPACYPDPCDTTATVDVGGTQVQGTTVVFRSEVAAPSGSHLAGSQLSASVIPSTSPTDLGICSENIGIADAVDATAVGDVRLSGREAGKKLRMENLASTSPRGAELRWNRPRSGGDKRKVSTHWSSLNDGGSVPVGSGLHFRATGDMGSTKDADLGSLDVVVEDDTPGAMRLRFSPDYSPVGSSSHRILVLSGGIVVDEVVGQVGDFNVDVSTMPSGCGKELVEIGGEPTACFRPKWPVPTEISLVTSSGKRAATVTGDEIAVLAENPTGAVDALRSFSVMATGISAMTLDSITLENVVTSNTPVPTPSPLIVRVAPNPFNPRTELTFRLDSPQDVQVRVYDVAGRVVRTLGEARRLPAGRHRMLWRGRDDHGREVSSGVYFLRVQTPDRVQSAKVALVR